MALCYVGRPPRYHAPGNIFGWKVRPTMASALDVPFHSLWVSRGQPFELGLYLLDDARGSCSEPQSHCSRGGSPPLHGSDHVNFHTILFLYRRCFPPASLLSQLVAASPCLHWYPHGTRCATILRHIGLVPG